LRTGVSRNRPSIDRLAETVHDAAEKRVPHPDRDRLPGGDDPAAYAHVLDVAEGHDQEAMAGEADHFTRCWFAACADFEQALFPDARRWSSGFQE
jgi:hypothetical protein